MTGWFGATGTSIIIYASLACDGSRHFERYKAPAPGRQGSRRFPRPGRLKTAPTSYPELIHIADSFHCFALSQNAAERVNLQYASRAGDPSDVELLVGTDALCQEPYARQNKHTGRNLCPAS